MGTILCTDPQALPILILQQVMMRWSVKIAFEKARTHLGLETQRQRLDQAIARTTFALLALF